MEGAFYKKSFTKTSSDRRDKVLTAAINEFAARGYLGTNINVVAEKAGISIGAMYSYFASKEDLFLTIVNMQFELIDKVIREIDGEDEFFSIIRQLFFAARDTTLEHPQLSQIYLDITTQPLSAMARRLSQKIETNMTNFLVGSISKAQMSGEICREYEPGVLAYLIDNLLVMFQFSFSSDYYRERMKLYLGDRDCRDDRVIDDIVAIIKCSGGAGS